MDMAGVPPGCRGSEMGCDQGNRGPAFTHTNNLSHQRRNIRYVFDDVIKPHLVDRIRGKRKTAGYIADDINRVARVSNRENKTLFSLVSTPQIELHAAWIISYKSTISLTLSATVGYSCGGNLPMSNAAFNFSAISAGSKAFSTI